MTAKLHHSASARSTGSREQVWCLISEVETWPEWNAAVTKLHLDGPFVTGTSGRLTPRNSGTSLPFVLTAVQAGRGYTSETAIADTVTLRTTTQLTEQVDGLVVSQRSELIGPAAEYFAPAFGESLVAGVEATVRSLASAPVQAS